MKTFLNRFFAPESNSCLTDAALLMLRLWLGLTMLFNHGLLKFSGFSTMKTQFSGLFGLSSEASLALAVFAEVGCAALLVVGLLSRFAALNLAVTMFVAFYTVHHLALRGEKPGELAFVYLAGFVALLIAGPGKFSADACVFKKPGAGNAAAKR